MIAQHAFFTYQIFHHLSIDSHDNIDIECHKIYNSFAQFKRISNLIGTWLDYFFGPRIMVNGIIFLECICILMLMAFFKFCARISQEMFYWLNIMDYDSETWYYFNMYLTESDSKVFIKRSSIFIKAFKCLTIVCISFFMIAVCISIFIHLNDNYLN